MAFNAKTREVYKSARNIREVIICYFVTRDHRQLRILLHLFYRQRLIMAKM